MLFKNKSAQLNNFYVIFSRLNLYYSLFIDIVDQEGTIFHYYLSKLEHKFI